MRKQLIEALKKRVEDAKRYGIPQFVMGLNDAIDIVEKEFVTIDKGGISDGYHTFDELYYHRMILFAVICNNNKDKAWKSWKHHDGTMFDDYFIVGIETVEGHYTYHYHKDHWEMFKVGEMVTAPEWDGHQPKDITRLLTL